MKVLISWSGELSHRVALLLRESLPMFIQVVEPWVSSEDIARGTLWRTELASELAQGSTGILCITRENVVPLGELRGRSAFEDTGNRTGDPVPL